MSVLIINPNSTAAMTEAMVAVARATVPEMRFEGWTSHAGPPSIQGPEDGACAAPPLLDLVQQAGRDAPQGIIIGCFDDTALAEAAACVRCPVVGLGQASFHYAAMRTWRFSVVTTLAVSVPIIEANVHASGLGDWLGRVRASDVPVLALEANPGAAQAPILAEARRAEAEDGVDAIILGCAGMVALSQAVDAALSVKVLDPVVVAASSLRWLASSGCRHT